MTFSLENQFISDTYSGVLHSSLSAIDNIANVKDGSGQSTALNLGLSAVGCEITTLTAGNIEYPVVDDFIKFMDFIYPVGSVIMSTEATNPGNRFPKTTWVQISQGKFIVGQGTGSDVSSSTKSFKVGNNDGSYQITLDSAQIPDHYHYIMYDAIDFVSYQETSQFNYMLKASGTTTNQSYYIGATSQEANVCKTSGVAGSGATPIELSPPAFGVYIWKRTV